MKFDVVSDLHVDLWNTDLDWNIVKNEDSDVLVIAGDTSNDLSDLVKVLDGASQVYSQVLFTDGNHEHYFTNKPVSETVDFFATLADCYDNVTYLTDGVVFEYQNTVFLGCCGWYDLQVHRERFGFKKLHDAWLAMSNDPKMINFGSIDPWDRAIASAEALISKVGSLQNSNTDIVVVTHTAPHRDLVGGIEFNPILDGAYCNTEMEKLLEVDENNLIKAWCYGHTHARRDRMIRHIRYVNNSRGYQSESYRASKWFVVQIDTQDQYSFSA
jgi:predicted phosphodiesterase